MDWTTSWTSNGNGSHGRNMSGEGGGYKRTREAREQAERLHEELEKKLGQGRDPSNPERTRKM